MSDQCKYCTMRGDFAGCVQTPCSQHESWYPLQMHSAVAVMREALEAIAGERPWIDNLMGDKDIARAALAALKEKN